MPKKKKPPLQVEIETSDDQDEKPALPARRSLRPRCKTTAKSFISKLSQKYLGFSPKDNSKTDDKSEKAYDADSESDENQDSESDDNPDSDSEADKRSMIADNYNICDSDAVMEETNLRNTTVPNNYDPFVIIDKENITPPGSHSTPAASQRVVRNLDESLFGFNNLESSLTLSPSKQTLDDPISPTVSSRSSCSISMSKRKRIQSGLVDVPVENPKKRTRKKTKKEVAIEDDHLEEIRKQFREVEMHELVIE